MISLASISRVRSVRKALALAVQEVYENWEPEDGYQTGNLSRIVAQSMLRVLKGAGIYAAINDDGLLAIRTPEGIFKLEVPAQVYETATGYNWRKTQGVTIASDNLIIDRLSEDPNAWATVTGLFLRSDDKWVDPKHGYPDASKLGAKDLTPQVLKDGWSPAPRPAVEFKPVENTAPVWLSAKVVNGKESATVTVNNVPEALPVLPVEAISPGPSPEWVQAQKSSAPVSEPVSVKNTPAPPSPSSPPPPAEPPVEYNPALDIMKASPVTVLKDRY